MSKIPEFRDAAENFKAFLRNEGYPAALVWVFRDDLWRISPSRLLVRRFRGDHNLGLAKKVFTEGRVKGQIELLAIARAGGVTLATIWYPKYEEEEVQGWSEGLKLAIAQPMPAAKRVSPVLWRILGLLLGFRAYQRNAVGIATKRWAAA